MSSIAVPTTRMSGRERRLREVRHTGQQLALGEVAGGAEQHDDVRCQRLARRASAGARRVPGRRWSEDGPPRSILQDDGESLQGGDGGVVLGTTALWARAPPKTLARATARHHRTRCRRFVGPEPGHPATGNPMLPRGPCTCRTCAPPCCSTSTARCSTPTTCTCSPGGRPSRTPGAARSRWRHPPRDRHPQRRPRAPPPRRGRREDRRRAQQPLRAAAREGEAVPGRPPTCSAPAPGAAWLSSSPPAARRRT